MPSPLDPPPQPTPWVTAQRLLARELGRATTVGAHDAGEVAAAGERLVARVTVGLSRSFGPYGAHALLSRALIRAQGNHPVLSTVTLAPVPRTGLIGAGHPPNSIVSLQAMTGPAEAVEGLTAWLAQLADLLGGLIGDGLAATLLEQSAVSRTDGAAPASAAFAGAPDTSDVAAPRDPNAPALPTVDEP